MTARAHVRRGVSRRGRRRMRRAARWFAAADLLALAALLTFSGHRTAAVLTGGGPTTATFTYSGAPQSFNVPAGVVSLSVDVEGAEGGGGPGTPGSGGDTTATLAVAPGDVLEVLVGGRGQVGSGGFNGGGAPAAAGFPLLPGGGGGGASDIRTGACAATLSCGPASRVVVAGGGGGADTTGLEPGEAGGAGGGVTGGAGNDPGALSLFGAGATAVAGGAGGGNGTTGALGQGGAGGAPVGPGAGGGAGGGGGYYGGGGGGGSGGGGGAPAGGDAGGGSGFGPPGAVLTSGVNSSDGVVSITYTGSATATTTSVSGAVPASPSVLGQPVTFTATVSPVPAGGTVQFEVDGSDVGAPVAVDGSGQATSAPIADMSVGAHAVVAAYGGDPGDLASISVPFGYSVAPAATSVAVAGVPDPGTVNVAVTYTATVTAAAPGAGVPSGAVGFTDDGVGVPACASVALDPSGEAGCTITEVAAGSRTIQATFAGSPDFTGSAGSVVEPIAAAPSPPPPPSPTTSVPSTTTSAAPTTTIGVTTTPRPPTSRPRRRPPPASTSVAPTTSVPSTTTSAAPSTTDAAPSTTAPPPSTTAPGAPPGDGSPPGAGPGAAGAGPSAGGSGSPGDAVHLVFGFSVGAQISGQSATVTASGLAPGSQSTITLHSLPTDLGAVTVGPAGTFSTVVRFPAGIPVGAHHVQVSGVAFDGRSVDGSWYLAVNEHGVVTRLDPTMHRRAPAWAKTLYAPYRVSQHAPRTVAILVSGFALLALVGGAGSFGHHPGGGSLASSKVKHAKRWKADEGAGDRSGTWQWPGVATVDQFGAAAPARLGPASPLAARVLNDSVWLRAMVGPLWMALPIVGVVLGAVGAVSVAGAAVPPSLGLVIAIVALSVFDAFAGVCAAVAFTVGVVLGGGLTSAAAVRGLMGIDMLFFVVPLIASASRPLRRKPGSTAADRFDRCGDVVIASLVAAWAAEKMVGGLPGLAGVSFPIASHAIPVAEAILAAMVVRMIGETVASWLYPSRLGAVAPEEIPSPGNRQQLVSIAFQTALLMFIAVAYLGNVWELYFGAALFAGPAVIQLYKDEIRNVPWLVCALPSGIVKTTVMMVVGTWFARFVASRITNPTRFVTEGFVVLTLPGLLLGTLSLLARDGKKWELNWLYRTAGVVVLGVAVLMAQKVVTIG